MCAGWSAAISAPAERRFLMPQDPRRVSPPSKFRLAFAGFFLLPPSRSLWVSSLFLMTFPPVGIMLASFSGWRFFFGSFCRRSCFLSIPPHWSRSSSAAGGLLLFLPGKVPGSHGFEGAFYRAYSCDLGLTFRGPPSGPPPGPLRVPSRKSFRPLTDAF